MSLPEWVQRAARLPVAFAQVREDAELDRRVVETLGPGARVLLVASGGCTAAALAARSRLALLHLVDPNPAQLALCRLKLRLLEDAPAERLRLLGHEPMPASERLEGLRSRGASLEALGDSADLGENGPDHCGRYERLFQAVRAGLLDVDGELRALMSLCEPAEQARRVAPDTALGAALDAAFERAMALPNLVQLFGEAATRNPRLPFAVHFRERTRRALGALPAADNPYLAQVLLGRFSGGAAAPWLAAPAAPVVTETRFSACGAAEALDEGAGSYDAVLLSNILDWLTPEAAGGLLESARRALRRGGAVLIRQLNSTLDVPALGPGFAWQKAAAGALLAADRSFLYRALHWGLKA